jgi:hypothetical protein
LQFLLAPSVQNNERAFPRKTPRRGGPIPEPAPVTMTTLFSNLFMASSIGI